MVRMMPWAIESTLTMTATTPAMPKIAAAEAPLRCGSASRLKRETANI